jgi:hypothetical protein
MEEITNPEFKTQEDARENPDPGSGPFAGARAGMDQAREKVQQQAKTMFASGKGRASANLHRVAQALRDTGRQLREQNYGSIAQYADKAADSVEQVSGYIQEKNVEELIEKAEDLTRRQPVLFLAGAFVTGLLLGRMVKGASIQA